MHSSCHVAANQKTVCSKKLRESNRKFVQQGRMLRDVLRVANYLDSINLAVVRFPLLAVVDTMLPRIFQDALPVQRVTPPVAFSAERL